MYKQIAANKRKTIFLMIGFVALIAAIAAVFAYYYNDWFILVWTFAIAIIYTLIQYFSATSVMASLA